MLSKLYNPIYDFVKETLTRWSAKSPTYFKIIYYAAFITSLVSGLGVFIEFLGVDLPTALDVIASKAVIIATALSGVIAKLTVDIPNPTIDNLIVEDGNEIETIDLPFTQKYDG